MATIGSSFVVDKAGRRVLLLSAALVNFICLIVLGGFFLAKSNGCVWVENLTIIPIIALCLFLFTNAGGLACVTFVIIGEIFAQNVKDTASGIAMTISYIFTIISTLLFPLLAENFGFEVAFFVFSVFIVAIFIFILFKVPETKGKTFQEIQNLMMKSN